MRQGFVPDAGRRSYFSLFRKGVLGFYNVSGVGARQPPAVFFPGPHLFRPMGVTVGCSGDTDFGAWLASAMSSTSALLNYSGPLGQLSADPKRP